MQFFSLIPVRPVVLWSLVLGFLFGTSAQAGSLVNRVVVVGDGISAEAIAQLQERLSTGYDVVTLAPTEIGTQGKDMDVLVLMPSDARKLESQMTAFLNAAPSTLDRVVVAIPEASGIDAKFRKGEGGMPANVPVLISGAVDPDLLAQAIVQPVETPPFDFQQSAAKAWKGEPKPSLSTWHGFRSCTHEAAGLEVIAPVRSRPGHPWIMLPHPQTRPPPGFETLAREFLDRGFHVVRICPSPAPGAGVERLARAYKLMTATGLANEGILATHGTEAATAFSWAASVPNAIRAIHADHPVLAAAQLPGIRSLAQYSGRERAGIALSLVAPDTDVLGREWEVGSGLLRRLDEENADIATWLHRNSHLMSASERFASRIVDPPLYPNVSKAEILARFSKSGWGDKPQRLRPGQNYFRGKPSRFDQTESFWRNEKKLLRSPDGILSGPTICLSQDELKRAPQPAVLLKDCVGALGDLAWHWEEDCRTLDDSKRLESLLLDLSTHTTAALYRWNAAETPIPGDQCDIGPLARLAGIAAILPADQGSWLGHLAFSNLKDRFKERPYNDMDVLRGTAAFPGAINLYRDADVRYRHIREMADYFDRTFHTTSGCDVEGAPHHHGIWHYSYAAYSIGSGYHVVRGFHDIGCHFSKNTYDKFKRIAVNMSLLSRPDLYGGEVPIAYNARAGTSCRLGWQALADACQLGDGRNPETPDPELLALLAKVEPGNPLLAALRSKGVVVPDHPVPVATLVNAGAMASRQYGRVQATVSGLSAPFNAIVEIYMNWGATYYALYLKAGSIFIRSPAADQAEAFDHYNGFDHSFIPGATSIVSTDRELFCRGITAAVGTAGIGGGTRSATNDAVVLGTDITNGPAPAAKKSYFIFGDRITALTSNVRRWSKPTFRYSAFLPIEDPARPIVTTLYQWPSVDTQAPDSERQQPLETPLPLVDRYGNAYVIHPAPNASCHFRSGLQSYLSFGKEKLKPGAPDRSGQSFKQMINGKITHDQILDSYLPSTGHWTRAWIQHEKADGSDAAACAYTLLVRGGEDQAKVLATQIAGNSAPYAIWQQDSKAHILRDKPSATTGYVLWEGGAVSTREGRLRATTAPCFLMLRDRPDGGIDVSFVNADSNAHRAIRLLFDGKWKPGHSEARLADGSRVVVASDPGSGGTEVTVQAPIPEDFLTFGPAWTASYYQTRHPLPAFFSLLPR